MNPSCSVSNISVIIPTYKRSYQLLQTIEKIRACFPVPAEILVHVDYGDEDTKAMLSETNPDVIILKSEQTQGPGGGRNRLIQQASCDCIACFDDDSWPMDKDYFAAALNLLQANLDVAVVNAEVFHPGEHSKPVSSEVYEVNSFQNCACIVRKEAFLNTQGYLPLRYAYGMEEADLALQFQDAGWRMLRSSQLRVYHDSDLHHHTSTMVNSWHITNTALLAYLRYPKRFWGIGCLKVLNRIRYALSAGRYSGILSGIVRIPLVIYRYRHYRKPIQVSTYRTHQQMGRST